MTSDGRVEVEKRTQQRGDIESEIEDYESAWGLSLRYGVVFQQPGKT